MVPYLFSFVLVNFTFLIYGCKNSRKRLVWMAFCGAFLALLIGFRGESVGEDTRSYLNIAEYAHNLNWSQVFASFPKSAYSITDYGGGYYYVNKIETLFLAFCKLIADIFNSEQLVLVFMASITVFGFFYFIWENSRNKYFSVYVFLCEFAFMNSFNISRQMMAMSIGINTYTLLRKKKTAKAIVLLLISTMIHTSAIIYALLFFLFWVKDFNKFLKLIVVGSCIAPFLVPVVKWIVARTFPYYLGYFEQNYWSNSVGGIILIWLVELFMIVITIVKKVRDREEFVPVACVIIYLALEIIALKISLFMRIALYMRAFLMLFFPNVFLSFNKKSRVLLEIGVWGMLLMQYVSYATQATRLYVPFWS